MSEYVIMTDNTVDMPLSWFQENQVDYLCLSCNMDGEIYDKEHVIDDKEFYRQHEGRFHAHHIPGKPHSGGRDF